MTNDLDKLETIWWYVRCDQRGERVYIQTKNLKYKVDEHLLKGEWYNGDKLIGRQYAVNKNSNDFQKLTKKMNLTEENRWKEERKRKSN